MSDVQPCAMGQTLKRSGAKYVVLTSKHHDGYCLWDNKEADQSWGRPWNSTNSGPMRDLLGELTKAVRNEGIKMGIYYSLYEWFNPIYRSNVHQFVEKHLFPQFKDVVNKYSLLSFFRMVSGTIQTQSGVHRNS